MKRFCSLLLAVIFTMSCITAIAAQIPTDLPTGALNSSATLYKKASTKSGAVATLKVEAEVEIIGETKSFYRVVSDNKAGYVLKKYIELPQEEEEPADAINSQAEDPNRLGSSKHPGKVGDILTLKMPVYEEDASGRHLKTDILTWQIKLVRAARGAQATEAMKKMSSSFTSMPYGQGYEDGLFELEVTLLDDPLDREEGFSLSNIRANAYDAKQKWCSYLYLVGADLFLMSARISEGETRTVFVKAPELSKDASYIVFECFGSETVWFKF